MSDLFIVRHGEASWQASTDAERELTERGVAQAETAALYIESIVTGRSVAQPMDIFVSPYRRAQQTAKPITKCFYAAQKQNVNWLIPSTTAAQALEGLAVAAAKKTGDTTILVSHQPLVSSLVAYIVDGDISEAGKYPMDTASIAHVNLENGIPGCGEFIGLYHFNDYRLEL